VNRFRKQLDRLILFLEKEDRAKIHRILEKAFIKSCRNLPDI